MSFYALLPVLRHMTPLYLFVRFIVLTWYSITTLLTLLWSF